MTNRWAQRAASTTNAVTFVVFGVVYVGMLVWGVVSVARHTVGSVALGIVLIVLALQALALRAYIVRHRLRAGRNIVTGVPRGTQTPAH